MKLNWGTGIVITLSLFAIGMGYAVYKAVNTKHDLVTTDYYQKELAYQSTIDAKKNAESLGENIQFDINGDQVSLIFPSSLEGKIGELELELYYPTMAKRDFNISKRDWSIGTIELPQEQLASGKWIAKAHLESAEINYYFETETVLH